MGGVIITIRNKMGYFLVVIISLAILGFLLMDSTSSNRNAFRRTSNDVGSVNGTGISYKDFQAKLDETIETYKRQQNVSNLSEEMTNALRNETWNNYVRDMIMDEQYEDLGLNVTVDETYEMFQGKNIHPTVRQQFTNPQTGLYDRSGVAMYIQNLGVDDQNGTAAEKKRRWRSFEDFINKDRLESKYSALIKQAIYTPKWMAEQNYGLANGSVSFEYVLLPFSSVKNSDVSVSESDLTAYLNAHTGRFQQKKSRIVDYVSFDIYPSASDSATTLKYIDDKLDKFQTTNDDSAFVRLYSDVPFNPNYTFKEELSPIIADTMFKVDSATMIGPYQEGGMYVVAKLADRMMLPDSVEARQIVFGVKTQDEVTTKKALADSILGELQAGNVKFSEMVLRYSDDDATKFDGGNMGYVLPGTQFRTIDRALFVNHKEGDIFLVPSNTGFHIIEITKRKPTREAVRVAYLARTITPSQATTDALFAEANEYLIAHNKPETFGKDKSVKTTKPFTLADNTLPGLGNARELVKWSFEAKKGDVSGIIILDDKFVIAELTDIREDGTATVANVRDELEQLVITEKKTQMLKDKIASGPAQDPTALAAAFGLQTDKVDGANLSKTDVGGANEPEVVAAAMALEKGGVSKPVAGNLGVYVLKVTEREAVGEPTGGYAYIQYQESMKDIQRVDVDVYNAIKENSDVEDERYKIY